jgi:hypothetical protein
MLSSPACLHAALPACPPPARLPCRTSRAYFSSSITAIKGKVVTLERALPLAVKKAYDAGDWGQVAGRCWLARRQPGCTCLPACLAACLVLQPPMPALP